MPNTPYLDKSVQWRLKTGNLAFHELRYGEVAQAILDAGLAERVLAKIGSGKEADVYLVEAHGGLRAVKAYRYYRTSHRSVGSVRPEGMGLIAAREFELLGYAFASRAPVPEPFERDEAMLAMAFVGDREGPAPRLKDATVEDPERFARELLEGIDRMLRAGVVHTDLSPFNILVHRDRPWIIDMADALRVDRLGGAPLERLVRARAALRQSLSTLRRHFQRYGVELPIEGVAESALERLDKFGLLERAGGTV